MSEPTISERILLALENNYAALTALLASNATSGQWAARGPLYLSGHPIRGGHPDDPSISDVVRIEGGTIEIFPDPATGHVKILGAQTPQLKRAKLEASKALTLADDGTLFISQHTDEDDEIILTLPPLTNEYDENDNEIVSGSTWYCQVFAAGSGVAKFAVTGANTFINAGVSSTTPVTIPAGKAAIAVYLGNGAWGVF